MIINESSEYQAAVKPPILTRIVRVLGWLIVSALFFGVIAFIKTGNATAAEVQGLLFMAGYALGAALVLFGVGEVVHLIAKIEHNTAQKKDHAILQSLHRIEAQLEKLTNETNTPTR